MSHLPASLSRPLREALAGIDDRTTITGAQPVSGGCINHALRLQTGQGVYLLKWNAAAPAGMFQTEARGLALLAGTHTVCVPKVLAFSEPSPQEPGQPAYPAFILLEWLEGFGEQDQAVLGEQLAALHRADLPPLQPPGYGLDHDNYIGSTPQRNSWDSDWVSFFASARLHPQMEMARRNGCLTAQRRDRLERLIQNLPRLLGGVNRRPSLIHGDLWGGNVIHGPDGLALIDPAASYSDREAEIAFTELFGGFTSRFYDAYQQAWPLESGYRERRDLYNLYHLLNHLNLFGESYGSQVDSVLRHFAG